MNVHKIIKSYTTPISSVLLVLTVFTLPLNLFLNNLFLTLFLICFGIHVLLNFNKETSLKIKADIFILITLSIPVIVLLVGMLYSPEYKRGFKDLGRLIPILIMVFYVLTTPSFFSGLLRHLLYALVMGCLISALICWGLTFVEMFQNQDPLSSLFTRKYAYHRLAEKIGIHTPYLALFVNTSIGFCVYGLYDKNRLLSNKLLVLLIIVLCVFLFNLMARNAIFCFVIFAVIFLLKSKKTLLLIVFFGILAVLATFTFVTEKNFLRDRFFKSVNVFENETIFSKKDGRFDRLSASFEVFKQFPLFGPGAQMDDKYRKEQYFINRDSLAYNENYNAHNQFLEYLSTYGLFGGISFLVLFFTLFRLVNNKKSYFLFFVVSCFFIANISESILERSWGVVYYILLVMLVLSWDKSLEIKINEHV